MRTCPIGCWPLEVDLLIGDFAGVLTHSCKNFSSRIVKYTMEDADISHEVLGLCIRSSGLEVILRTDGPTARYTIGFPNGRPAFVVEESSSRVHSCSAAPCPSILPLCATNAATIAALSSGWVILDNSSGMLLFVDNSGGCRAVADFGRADVVSLFVDSAGSIWLTRDDGSVHALSFDRHRRCWKRDIDAWLGCELGGGCVLTIAESAALLPPALFGDECGAPHRSASAGLSIALSDTMADVAAILDGRPVTATRACDGYLRRLIARHADGSVAAYTVPTVDAAGVGGLPSAAGSPAHASAVGRLPPGAAHIGGSASIAGSIDSAAAAAALRQTTAVVATGLLTAVRTLRDSRGGQAVQSYFGPASRWVPQWVAQGVRDAAAGRFLDGAASGAASGAATDAGSGSVIGAGAAAGTDASSSNVASVVSAGAAAASSAPDVRIVSGGPSLASSETASGAASAVFTGSASSGASNAVFTGSASSGRVSGTGSAAVVASDSAAAGTEAAAVPAAPADVDASRPMASEAVLSESRLPAAAGRTIAAIPQATVPLDAPEQLIIVPPLSPGSAGGGGGPGSRGGNGASGGAGRGSGHAAHASRSGSRLAASAESHSNLPRMVHCTRDFTLPDSSKRFRCVVPAPHGHLLLAADAGGRVLLLDGADLTVLRLWKGYRDAQVAWVLVRPPAPQTGAAAAPPGSAESAASEAPLGCAGAAAAAAREPCDAEPAAAAPGINNHRCSVSASSAEGRLTQLVVIFAPRRACIEIWWPHGELVARVRVPPRIASLHGVRLLPVMQEGSINACGRSASDAVAPLLPGNWVALALPADTYTSDNVAENYSTGGPHPVAEDMTPYCKLRLPPVEVLLLDVSSLAGASALS